MSTYRDYFEQHQAQTTTSPIGLEIDRAEGIYLYDPEGKRYMDLISGVAVSNIGHRHPKVLDAIRAQLDRHLHVMVYGEYVQEVQAKLAKRLSEVLPESLDCVYFVNSGTEANEAAIKLAKRVTGRTEIIAADKSYHGNTHGSLSISGNEHKKNAFRPLLPDVHFIRFNDINELDRITENTAGVILEPVQGDAGVRIPDADYLAAVRKRCDETGALLIFDEIQTGFGRTGSLFAFEQLGAIPHVITMAKGMGGGMPIGAFAASREHMHTLADNPMLGHITTFGGHPVNCAAALANLEVLLEENWIAEAGEKGELFKSELQHPNVREIRGIGLMLAIELADFDQVYQLFHHCLERGVIGFWFISSNNSFRLAPPLCITREEIREACAVIRDGLDQLQ